MAFFLVEGFKHTSNIKKYLGRIFLFAVISQIPYLWAYRAPSIIYPLNIMFTLFLGLLMIYLHEQMESRGGFWFLFVVFLLVSFAMEWSLVGIIMILMYKVIQDEKKRRFWPPALAFFVNGGLGLLLMGLAALVNSLGDIPELAEFYELGFEFTVSAMSLTLFFGLGSLLATFFLRNYNGERGKSMKYLFYVIYPLHFVVLGVLALVLNID